MTKFRSRVLAASQVMHKLKFFAKLHQAVAAESFLHPPSCIPHPPILASASWHVESHKDMRGYKFDMLDKSRLHGNGKWDAGNGKWELGAGWESTCNPPVAAPWAINAGKLCGRMPSSHYWQCQDSGFCTLDCGVNASGNIDIAFSSAM